MDSGGMSAADVVAMTKGDSGFLEGNGIIILILFFLLMGAGGGGLWGSNAGNALTQSELQMGLYDQTANSDRLMMMQQNWQNSRDTLENRYESALQSQAIQAQASVNNCEVNRNIDAIRTENYRNTCEITSAIQSEAAATREMFTQNIIQQLRDKNNKYQNQITNLLQTQSIVNQLRPTPIPAYITCSPYTANSCGCNNCSLG